MIPQTIDNDIEKARSRAAEEQARKVHEWRLLELLRAGYDQGIAEELAARPEIDLHVACEMLSDGCEPALAAKILL